ncbi:hypothetical protein TNCV_1644651 [Trichonephila clavipes]|nr:hypothetical protein TNCV_1644651 [Trichonephila clavipes]
MKPLLCCISGRSIGCGGPVTWPPRAPTFNLLDFFFWGHLKSLVYETLVATKNLTELNVVSSADIAGSPDLFERFYNPSVLAVL